MSEVKLFKVENPDDPRRCQSNIQNSQCPFRAERDSIYCHIHQGISGPKGFDNQMRNYRLAKWQARISEFADNNQVKSLREEIGILRMVLEEILSHCQDQDDIILYSSKIADHVVKIERVVTSCHKLEESTKLLLDKGKIIQLAGVMVEVIGKYILDVNLLDKISDDIVQTVLKDKSMDEDI